VSGRAGAKAGGSNLSAIHTIPSRDVTVKGILVFWKAAPFAGRRRNEGLGRSARCRGYPPAAEGAPMTADVRRTPRRGTPSACATKRMHPTQAREIVACARGRVLRSVLRPVHVDPHYAPQAQASEVGRSSEHHGWANSGNREEPALGLTRADVARLAACHRSRKGGSVACREKEGDRGLPPCED
jgi:hypothetical protein